MTTLNREEIIEAIELKHYNGCGNTPANLFIMKAYLDLIENKLSSNTSGDNWNDKIIAAFADNECIGVLTWEKVDWNKTIVIKLGYVHKDYRRKGVYTKLWNELILKAKEQSIYIIEGATHVDNGVMQKTMKRLERKPYAYFYKYEIIQEVVA